MKNETSSVPVPFTDDVSQFPRAHFNLERLRGNLWPKIAMVPGQTEKNEIEKT